MGELRRDPILGHWVVFSPKRGKRPHELHAPKKEQESKQCFFCPGSEHLTPPEIGRIPDGKGWKIRWFENKFGIVSLSESDEVELTEPWWVHMGNFGHHEVIVETNDHQKQLWDLSLQELAWLLGVYDHRIQKIQRVKGIAYVQVFKNHGVAAGTSIVHSHSQIIALPFMPHHVQQELQAVELADECPYCKLVATEVHGQRLCLENESFVAIAPYASQFQYEVAIFPKAHVKTLDGISSPLLLADIMKRVLGKLKEMGADFNMAIHYAPRGRNHHMHVRFLPRLSKWAGFEHGTGIIVNPILPEVAAKFYRGEK